MALTLSLPTALGGVGQEQASPLLMLERKKPVSPSLALTTPSPPPNSATLSLLPEKWQWTSLKGRLHCSGSPCGCLASTHTSLPFLS